MPLVSEQVCEESLLLLQGEMEGEARWNAVRPRLVSNECDATRSSVRAFVGRIAILCGALGGGIGESHLATAQLAIVVRLLRKQRRERTLKI